MKNFKIGILLFCLVFIIGCNSKETNNTTVSDITVWDSVKTSTSHYDYLNFMIKYTNSMYFDSALIKYFKYQELLWDSTGPPIWTCCNRCISVAITKSDTILFEYEPILIDDLRKNSLTYLINENNDKGMPDKKLVEDKNGDKRYVSNGYFYIQTDLESNDKLKQGINEIKLAFTDYKNYLSEKWFNMKFDELKTDKKRLIEDLVMQGYKLDRYCEIIIVDYDLDEDFELFNFE